MNHFRPWCFLLAVFGVLITIQPRVLADSLPLTVSVGYADNIHCAQFNVNPGDCVSNPPAAFPSPWQGSAGISQFIGTGVDGVGFDAGALLLTNNSGAAVNVGDVTVTFGGTSFDLWGSFTVPTGQSVILTQTNFDPITLAPNFDTSDLTGCCTNNGVIPSIAITIAGTTTTLMDSNQILNTGGFDLGCSNPVSDPNCLLTNESHPWSLVPGQAPAATPEPSSLLLMGTGVLLFLGFGIRRKLCW